MPSDRLAARCWLTVSAILIPVLLWFPAAAGSLCGDGEQAWFEAVVTETGELVSVCGAVPVRDELKWLQFRMGTPDRLTLAWPEKREGSLRAFTYRRYTRYRVTLLKLGFRIGDRDYAMLEHDLSEDKPEYGLSLRIRQAETQTELADHKLTPVTRRLAIMRLERFMEAKPYDE